MSSSENADSKDDNNLVDTKGSRAGNENNYIKATPERWILFLGIALLVIGVLFLTLRSVLFSLILIIAGVSVFTYWLYINTKSRDRSTTTEKLEGNCICSICGHRESGMCIEHKCACCILMRNNKIIGHSNNPLQ